MANRRFWKGFAAGAAAGAGGVLGALAASSMIGSTRTVKIARIEKSIQIGRPVEDVFRNWTALEWLPTTSDLVQNVQVTANRSHWTMRLNGWPVEWDAQVEQLVPNQAIGWKSINGPKHTGRITFAPIGNDTLMQVTMNHFPRRGLRPFTRQMTWPLEHWVERVLRDFKASLEGKGMENRKPVMRAEGGLPGPGVEISQSGAQRATGTYGRSDTSNSPFADHSNPVDYTAPPEAKR